MTCPPISNTPVKPARASETATGPTGGAPTEWLRPDLRALGNAAISKGMNARDTTQAAMIARNAPADKRAATAATRISCEPIRDSTPYVPMWLSFMISNRRSGVNPPHRPSNVSASPSSCIAPVVMVRVATSKTAQTNGGTDSVSASHPMTQANIPITKPTTGKAQTACACRAKTLSGKRGRGRRVNRTSASGISHAETGLVSFFCTSAPFEALLDSVLRLNTQDHSDAMRL